MTGHYYSMSDNVAKQNIHKWIIPASLALVFIFAGYTRIISLLNVADNPLPPDSAFYFHIAKTLRSPFATHHREPFFIWIVWMFLRILGEHPIIIRIVSLLFSFIAIWCTYFVGTRVFNKFVGIVSAFLMASSPSLGYMSIRGLRFELQIILFLLMVYLLISFSSKKPLYKALVLGISGGIISLAFISFTFIYIVIASMVIIKQKWRWCWALLTFSILFLMLSPYLLYCLQRFNDPFYSMNVHARYYRNYEHVGEPGFMTEEELSKHPYAGKPVTTSEYIFGSHSPATIVGNSVKGFIAIFAGHYARDIVFNQSYPLLVLYIIGAIAVLFSPQRLVLVPFFLWGAMISFLVGTVQLDWRIILITVPVFYICAAWGIYKSVLYFREQFPRTY